MRTFFIEYNRNMVCKEYSTPQSDTLILFQTEDDTFKEKLGFVKNVAGTFEPRTEAAPFKIGEIANQLGLDELARRVEISDGISVFFKTVKEFGDWFHEYRDHLDGEGFELGEGDSVLAIHIPEQSFEEIFPLLWHSPKGVTW